METVWAARFSYRSISDSLHTEISGLIERFLDDPSVLALCVISVLASVLDVIYALLHYLNNCIICMHVQARDCMPINIHI